jgi:hypothetical protein
MICSPLAASSVRWLAGKCLAANRKVAIVDFANAVLLKVIRFWLARFKPQGAGRLERLERAES